jgi:predicted nucleotidyltransferase
MFRKEIYHLIRNDWQLREVIADILGVSEGTVYGHAVRKSIRLEHYLVVKKLMLHTGKKDTEIFINKN